MAGQGKRRIRSSPHRKLRHDARVWPLIVGTTSSGAKGTSRATVQRVIGAAVKRLDVSPQMRAGLSSGEGLIESVRDASGDEDSDKFDPGVDDKRLLVIEPEFASVLKRANRKGTRLVRCCAARGTAARSL